MIAAVRRVSLRHLASHKLRTAFTVAGIALGVSTMIGMRLMHESVATSYERMVERIAGKAELQITNGEVGVPEELLEEIRAVQGVRAAVASVQGFLSAVDFPGERLYVFGVDLLADQELRDYESGSGDATIEDPLVFLAQTDSVGLTQEFLDRTGLALESPLRILAPVGTRELVVRAALDPKTGPASLFDGRIALMDVFAAQALFGFEKRFSQIDVGLVKGADDETVAAALREAVAGRGIVERPSARGETLEKLLTAQRYGMTVAALLALVVGLYLIFNTMMVAVVQRRRELGILRALGLRRRDVLGMILVEALVLGALGSALGVPLGLGLARGMAAAFALNVSTTYAATEVPDVGLSLMPVLWGIGLGMLSALAAAWLPARQAVRVHPLEVLRPGATPSDRRGAYTRFAVIGIAIGLGTFVLWQSRGLLPISPNALGALAMVGCLVGTSLAVPAAVRWVALRVEPALARTLGPIGAIAARSIVAHIGRVAITCSAFLVSLAGAIAMSTWLSSIQFTMTTWMNTLFSNIDLVISSGAKPLSSESTPLPASLAAEIAALPEVKRVDSVRIVRVAYGGRLTAITATEAQLFAEGIRKHTLLEGEEAPTYAALAAGKAVAVNEAFQRRFGKGVGEEIELVTPSGPLRLPIAAIYFDPAFADLGIVLMDRGLYRRAWRDDTVNFLEPILHAGADREAVIRTIRERWGAKHDLFVVTIEQFAGEARELINQMLSMIYPLIGISIAIALLGVVNSLLASVLDRVREIGVLRAIGATRAQVARIIVVEATLIGCLGGIFAVAVGSLLGVLQVDVLMRGMFAMTMLYRYPTEAVVVSVVAAIVLAAAAGYLPGRKAARINIVEALEYE